MNISRTMANVVKQRAQREILAAIKHGDHDQSTHAGGGGEMSAMDAATEWKDKMAERPSEALQSAVNREIDNATPQNIKTYRGSSVEDLKRQGVDVMVRGDGSVYASGEITTDGVSFSDDVETAEVYAFASDTPVIIEVSDRHPSKSFDVQSEYDPSAVVDDNVSSQESERLIGGTLQIMGSSMRPGEEVPRIQVRQTHTPNGDPVETE